ncbi:MAG: peptide MFS transporter, partial [Bacteroidota bacterium]
IMPSRPSPAPDGERFSYYGMRAILVLYITTSTTDWNPGLGWDNADALALYGWYTMLVYVMSIPGGIIADKFIGQKKSVLLGGLILVAGHGILAVEQMWAFYLGLALIILGVGGLKPNISTMVGGLYKQGDIRRDKGFIIFYIGINLGAALASLAVGYVGEKIGWHYGFGMAGIGMLLGQLIFMLGQKHLEGVGEKPVVGEQSEESGSSFGQLFVKIFTHKVALIVTCLLLLSSIGIFALLSVGYGLLGIFLAIVVGMMIAIYSELERIEKDRFLVLLLSFILVIVFWGAFEQAGGLMNIYTAKKVNLNVLGYDLPASVFQSVNAIFIILFGTLVANFWAKRKKKGKESSSLFKMAIGTIIMGVGFLAMVKASLEVLSSGEAALIWIILAYFLHTIGELSSSPVALSFITKLAPAKYVSIMMGVYFAATGLGNKVAGAIGEASQTEPIKVEIAQNASSSQLIFANTDSIANGSNFEAQAQAYVDGSNVIITDTLGTDISSLLTLDEENKKELLAQMNTEDHSSEEPLRLNFEFESKDKIKGDVSAYSSKVEVFKVANKRELKTFLFIFVFTLVVGLIVIALLKQLKKLTHGIEEAEK